MWEWEKPVAEVRDEMLVLYLIIACYFLNLELLFSKAHFV